MDLHLIPGATATSDERLAVDATIASDNVGPIDGSLRHLLLPVLHNLQEQAGWISAGALNYACERLGVPPADAYGVAAFYAMFSLERRPRTVVHVCDDIACRANGAEDLCGRLEQQLGPAGTHKAGTNAMWLRSPCLGQCDRGPAVYYQVAGPERTHWAMTRATPDAVLTVLGADRRYSPRLTDATPQTGEHRVDELRLLRRIGIVDPESVDDYRAHGGYSALRRAFALGPDRILHEVTESKLVGRGGAAFPAGRKWVAVARSPVRPHYLVCNADESEPGTFKDRVLMEEDPFALLEAMTIAAYATGCELGFIYVRGEYPLATARLERAILQARARGLLGEDVLGHGVRFDIELRRGAGAYICGEETALFNSIEGFRGEPRNKPPFPVQAGLFGKPTVINNVETLLNVLEIAHNGGEWFAATGTAGSTGTKLFCLSGSVKRPGVYEVPFGTTLRDLIELAGGVPDGRTLQAVLLGGAAGMFVTPDELDMPLTLEGARAANATLGSGVVMPFDDSIDLRAIVLRIAQFFRDESCGQCVPCRVGTMRQEEALHRLARAPSGVGSVHDEIACIDDLAVVMRDASICGLGQTASSAIQTAIRKLRLFQVEKV